MVKKKAEAATRPTRLASTLPMARSCCPLPSGRLTSILSFEVCTRAAEYAYLVR